MSLDLRPQLGTKPVVLSVRLSPLSEKLSEKLSDGLRELYRQGALTDVALICSGQTFRVHGVVLAAQSEVFRKGLSVAPDAAAVAQGAKHEIRLADVSNPEAVKFMLDYIYQVDGSVWEDYNPRTQEINKDVLRLAQNFQLPGLTERATHWLGKDLTTGNCVERLTICDDFGLVELREKILEQLTMNKKALAEVAHSPQIMSYPKLMQALLMQAAASASEPASPPQPKKKLKKG